MNKGEQLVADKYINLGYEIIKTGIPDFLILKDGKLSFVEVKSEEQFNLSKSQERAHEILLRNGFEVKIEVVYLINRDNSVCLFQEEWSEFIRINKTKNVMAAAEEVIKKRIAGRH